MAFTSSPSDAEDASADGRHALQRGAAVAVAHDRFARPAAGDPAGRHPPTGDASSGNALRAQAVLRGSQGEARLASAGLLRGEDKGGPIVAGIRIRVIVGVIPPQ